MSLEVYAQTLSIAHTNEPVNAKRRRSNMPYIITTSLYPSEIAPKVGARYLEALAKFPPDESLSTQVVPAAVTTTHQGIKVTGISDVKEGKLEEALRRAGDFMIMFQNIAGFLLDRSLAHPADHLFPINIIPLTNRTSVLPVQIETDIRCGVIARKTKSGFCIEPKWKKHD